MLLVIFIAEKKQLFVPTSLYFPYNDSIDILMLQHAPKGISKADSHTVIGV